MRLMSCVGKAEPLEELLGARLLAVDDVAALVVREHLADRARKVRGELLELLREHAKAHGLPDLYAAAQWLEFATYDVDEGRLAGTVLAEQAKAVTRADEPGDVLKNRVTRFGTGLFCVIRVASCDVENVDHLLAEARHREPLELELVSERRNIGDELARGLDAELGLGASRLRSAREPGELFAGHVAPALLGHRREPVALHALQDVGRVAAFKGVDARVVHLPHLEGHLVEEPPVVRYDEQRPRARLPAGLEVSGKPVDGPHVEVVSRLVQREHVPVADEEPREVHAPALATRELAHAGLPRHVGDEPLEDRADARARGPFVLGGVAHYGLVNRLGVVEGVTLAEEPHREAAPVRDAPGVGLEGAREECEQSRLAVAVLADDADTVALVYTEGHVAKDLLGGEVERDAVAAEENRHETSFLWCGEARAVCAAPGLAVVRWARVAARAVPQGCRGSLSP